MIVSCLIIILLILQLISHAVTKSEDEISIEFAIPEVEPVEPIDG